MRTFYEQFFEIYDSITKLYFFQSIGDDFHIKEILINLREKDNIFIDYKNESIRLGLNFLIDYKVDLHISDFDSDNIIRVYNYMNRIKLNMDKIKEAYDEKVATQVCETLKQS